MKITGVSDLFTFWVRMHYIFTAPQVDHEILYFEFYSILKYNGKIFILRTDLIYYYIEKTENILKYL